MASSTQEEKLAITFAPMPFAIISFISSSYAIYFLLHKDRARLKRIYHRLVLAMNLALLPLSAMWVWGPFAVPEGTPNYPVALGTVQTCTAQAFISLVFSLAVPTYYASLSLQALLGIKNKFKEEKYRWMEKWVHVFAYCIPCAISAVYAATDNFNPAAAVCNIDKAPAGCSSDPNVTCQRGKEIRNFNRIVGLILISLYFVFPPSFIISMHCWIRNVGKKIHQSTGMHRLRKSAQKKMLQIIAKQSSLYLFSFWATWVLMLTSYAYRLLNAGAVLYNLAVVANCLHALQGFLFTMVYFGLEKLGNWEVDVVTPMSPPMQREKYAITVSDIREIAEFKDQNGSPETDNGRVSYSFNVFDGTPSEDSPWVKFFYLEGGDGDEDPDKGPNATNVNDIEEAIGTDTTVSGGGKSLSKTLIRIMSISLGRDL